MHANNILILISGALLSYSKISRMGIMGKLNNLIIPKFFFCLLLLLFVFHIVTLFEGKLSLVGLFIR